MKRILPSLVLITCAVFAGCSMGSLGSGRDERDSATWDRIGRVVVDPSNSSGVLSSESNKLYRRLRVETRGNVRLRTMRVTFANGQAFAPNVAGMESNDRRAFDLPGESKRIERIEFDYRASGNGTHAVVAFGER